jgi:hypothetical protein
MVCRQLPLIRPSCVKIRFVNINPACSSCVKPTNPAGFTQLPHPGRVKHSNRPAGFLFCPSHIHQPQAPPPQQTPLLPDSIRKQGRIQNSAGVYHVGFQLKARKVNQHSGIANFFLTKHFCSANRQHLPHHTPLPRHQFRKQYAADIAQPQCFLLPARGIVFLL